MTKIVNFFAGPGAGKSTTKAGLFFEMKLAGFRVESVDEYAKEVVYETGGTDSVSEMYMLAEQDRRLRRLVGKVDYVLTDAPLLKSLFYLKGVYASGGYADHINRLFDSYDNFNVWVGRVQPYLPYGREQTEAEADKIHSEMYSNVESRLHLCVLGNREAPSRVLRALRLAT